MQTSFFLKYRPQKFCDLDSTLAREELIKIFSSGKIPHALLFTGPKGIGKTSAARIVAKAVNCIQVQSTEDRAHSKEKNYEPCNECDNCKSITAGNNMDIIEIDAASNRGIDDIKDLREKIKLSPAFLKNKVYIIDEVHMLTTEAFNALLKTLEEPPKHAFFVLCTTDTEKLPKTIISRCQQINFKKATKAEVVRRLKIICELEKIEFEEKGLEEIAKLSEGSFRDATKILEQVSLSGKVSFEEVQRSAGIFMEYNPKDLIVLLEKRETKEALEWIGKATEAGTNLKVFLEYLTEYLRIILLKDLGITSEEQIESELTQVEAKQLITLFSKAYSELKFAVIPQLPIEMAIVEWSSFAKASEDEGEAKEVGSEKLEKEVGGANKDNKKHLDNQDIPPQNQASHFSPQTSFSLEIVLSKWSEILEKVKPLNHSVLAFLRATRPVSVDGGFLTLEVFYKFHKEQLEKDQCRKIFETAASEVINSPVRLRCILGEKPQKIQEEHESKKVEEWKVEKPAGHEVNKSELSESDIMKIAEEIFSGTSVQ